MPTQLRSAVIFVAQLVAIAVVSWAGLSAIRALLLVDAEPIWISQLLSAGAGTLCFVAAVVVAPVRGSRDIRLLVRGVTVCMGLLFWTQALRWLHPGNLDEELLNAVAFGLIALILALALTIVAGDRFQLVGWRLALLFAVVALGIGSFYYALVLQ